MNAHRPPASVPPSSILPPGTGRSGPGSRLRRAALARKLAPRAGFAETVWLLFLAGLTILMLDLGTSDAGSRIFGSRAQILCLVSAGLLGLCTVARIAAFATGRRSSYVRFDLVLFFLPFAFAPLAGYLDGATALAMTRQFVPPAAQRNASDPFTGTALSEPAKQVPVSPPMPILAGGSLRFDARNFRTNYDAVYAAPKSFSGMKIHLEGFVLPSDEIGLSGFVVGRNLIWCCSADGIMLGIPARLPEGAAMPEAGAWIEMEGRLDSFEMAQGSVVQGQDMSGTLLPLIHIETILTKVMPRDPYLYP